MSFDMPIFDMVKIMLPFLLLALIILAVRFLPEYLYDLHMQKRLRSAGLDKIDTMPGEMFERRLQVLFKDLGYRVKRTRLVGDKGADLILEKDGVKTVVQAKRYKGKVGIKAIQEAVAAKGYYGCSKAMVVTNSYYTKPAWELAKANDVELWNRKQLINALLKVAAKQGTTPQTEDIHNTAQSLKCDKCGKEITPGIKRYCQRNKDRFGGKNYCMSCQKKIN